MQKPLEQLLLSWNDNADTRICISLGPLNLLSAFGFEWTNMRSGKRVCRRRRRQIQSEDQKSQTDQRQNRGRWMKPLSALSCFSILWQTVTNDGWNKEERQAKERDWCPAGVKYRSNVLLHSSLPQTPSAEDFFLYNSVSVHFLSWLNLNSQWSKHNCVVCVKIPAHFYMYVQLKCTRPLHSLRGRLYASVHEADYSTAER